MQINWLCKCKITKRQNKGNICEINLCNEHCELYKCGTFVYQLFFFRLFVSKSYKQVHDRTVYDGSVYFRYLSTWYLTQLDCMSYMAAGVL